MKPTSLLVLGFAVFSHALGPVAPIPGYEVFIPQWEVEVSPGGPTVAVNGTIQQIREEMLKLNPKWDEDFLMGNLSEENGLLAGRTLEQRSDFSESSHFCRDRWLETLRNPVVSGINYLRGVNGRPTNGAGPGNCGRVSCSYHAAIWWCNDDREPKTLDSFASIADGAQFIVDHCSRSFSGHNVYLVSGQVFTKNNWNVIVREDTDNC